MMRLFLTAIFFFTGFIHTKGQLLKQDLTIGSEKDKIHFGSIQNIDVDSKGTIYISDWDTRNIRVFNKNGELKTTIGRQGRGPGEFEQLDGSGLNGLDQLYAYDPTLIRVSIFNIPSNTLTNTLNIPKLESNIKYGSRPRDIFVFKRSNKFLLKYITPYSPATSQVERKQNLVLFNEAGEIINEPLLTIRQDQKLIQDQGVRISVGPMPFGRRSLVEVGSDDRIYTAWTEELNIKIYNQEGQYLKSISDQVKKINVSDTDLQQKNEEISSFDYLDFTEQIPDNWPAFDWFEVDDKDRIWIAVNTKDRDKYSLKIYNQKGKKIGQTSISKAMELKEIRDGFAYCVKKGEKDLQSVIRFKIKGLESQ